jgi:hypothetical protein
VHIGTAESVQCLGRGKICSKCAMLGKCFLAYVCKGGVQAFMGWLRKLQGHNICDCGCWGEQESGDKVTDEDELQRLKVSLEAIMAAGRRPLSRSASKRPELVPRQEVKNEILLKIKGSAPPCREATDSAKGSTQH